MKSPIGIVAKAAAKLKLACMSAAVATLMFCPAVLGQVEVTAESVTDTRTDTFNSKLDIYLKFFEDMLVDAKAIRVNVDRAVDETGKSIINNESEESESEFEEISFPGYNYTRAYLKLKSPTRQAATIKEISGTLEMFIPDRNAKSTVTVKNILEKTGVPISNSVLKSSDIEVLIQKPEDMNQHEECEVDRQATQQEEDSMSARSLTSVFTEFKCSIFASTFASTFVSIPKDKSIIILIRDVDSKLKGIEFESESGEVIRHNGSSTFGDSEEEIRVYDFEEKLPPKIRLNLYLFRAESVVTVPFKAVDIPLP
ncbi:MAG: hypothetical protein SWX82_03110 [Cyanobacteriota bacterium]|nr:hypothetical protein [Cyanobacteriota bacterium]